MELAFEFRKKFNKDIVIDIIGYRRFGHNELDQPSFTQPLMYSKINNTLPVFEKYSKKLIEEKVMTEEYKKEQMDILMKENNDEFNIIKTIQNKKLERQKWQIKPWEIPIIPLLHGKIKDTGINLETLKTLGK